MIPRTAAGVNFCEGIVLITIPSPTASQGGGGDPTHAAIREFLSRILAAVRVGSELWEVRETAGGMIGLELQYRGAVPTRAKVEAKPRSPVNPEFFWIYHVDQGVDVVKSSPQGIDRVQHYQLRVTVSELGKLFDGTEQLVSVAVLPWYVRQGFLP